MLDNSRTIGKYDKGKFMLYCFHAFYTHLRYLRFCYKKIDLAGYGNIWHDDLVWQNPSLVRFMF
jgi:hypothetical protein